MKNLKELASRAHEVRRMVDGRAILREGNVITSSTDADVSTLATIVAELADALEEMRVGK